MADKKELNLEEADNISGGMPNPNSMTPEEFDKWCKEHQQQQRPGRPIIVGAPAPADDDMKPGNSLDPAHQKPVNISHPIIDDKALI